MRQFKLFLLAFLVVFSANNLFAGNKFVPSDNENLAVVYTFDEIIDEKFESFIRKDLKEIGYFLNDPHRRVNDAYKNEYGSTYLDILSFSSILNESVVRPLLNKDPRLGSFNPFNLLIYRKKDDKKTYIAHLTPEAILDISQIDDVEIRKTYTKSFEVLDKSIREKLGGKKGFVKLEAYAQKPMMNFEIPIGEPEDIDDFLDDFQDKFEGAFEKKGYVMAGFYNIKESLNSNQDVMPEYTAYWSYDLCHIPFSYALFDGVNGIPVAGIFAPCSMYVYLREDEKKLVIGMPRLETWAKAIGLSDAERLSLIKRIDKEIPEIISSLGGHETNNQNPLLKK